MSAGKRGRQTAAPGFKRWFGDSKVVDEDGRPKVMYHGTDAEEEFTRFEFTEDVGFHFGPPGTANARLVQIEASDHARIIPVYLSIKNPLRLPDLMTWGPGEVILALGDADVLSKRRTRELLNEGYFDEVDFRRALKNKGYDGVVYQNSTEGGGDSYIALRPEQIRFAIGGPTRPSGTTTISRTERRSSSPGERRTWRSRTKQKGRVRRCRCPHGLPLHRRGGGRAPRRADARHRGERGPRM